MNGRYIKLNIKKSICYISSKVKEKKRTEDNSADEVTNELWPVILDRLESAMWLSLRYRGSQKQNP